MAAFSSPLAMSQLSTNRVLRLFLGFSAPEPAPAPQDPPIRRPQTLRSPETPDSPIRRPQTPRSGDPRLSEPLGALRAPLNHPRSQAPKGLPDLWPRSARSWTRLGSTDPRGGLSRPSPFRCGDWTSSPPSLRSPPPAARALRQGPATPPPARRGRRATPRRCVGSREGRN
ncbi:unnamed protein product [Rangifer tarandus platyrhynchus]|uniref:Uncharacterized protein n=1 Tax=Rangifer tarandus platyrhynchus TaxID=3082113 RepID=A0AC59Y9A6_RANTA